MTIVNIDEAQAQLSTLIQKVLEGEKVVIAKNDEPMVSLNKIKTISGKRKGFGSLEGKIWVSDDCWDEDEEMTDLMTSGTISPDANTD